MSVIQRYQLVFACMKAVSRNVENKDEILHVVTSAIVGNDVSRDKQKKWADHGRIRPFRVADAMVSLMRLNKPEFLRCAFENETGKENLGSAIERLSSLPVSSSTRETSLEREKSRGYVEEYAESVMSIFIKNRLLRPIIQVCCVKDETLCSDIVRARALEKQFEINKIIMTIKNRLSIARRPYRCFLLPNVRKLLGILGIDKPASIVGRVDTRDDESSYYDEIEKVVCDDSFYATRRHGIDKGCYVRLRKNYTTGLLRVESIVARDENGEVSRVRLSDDEEYDRDEILAPRSKDALVLQTRQNQQSAHVASFDSLWKILVESSRVRSTDKVMASLDGADMYASNFEVRLPMSSFVFRIMRPDFQLAQSALESFDLAVSNTGTCTSCLLFHVSDLVRTVKYQFRLELRRKTTSLARLIMGTLRPIEHVLERKHKLSKPVTWSPVVVENVPSGSENSVRVKIRGVEMTVKADSCGNSVEIKCPEQTRIYGNGKYADVLCFANDAFSSVADLLRDVIGKPLQSTRVTG
eukprot:g2830.t1